MSVAKAGEAIKIDPEQNWRGGPLQGRPGFLIRRLHQIHTALFTEECGEEKITPIMYSVLSALSQVGPVDQTTLARAVAIDKTNMADILERLRKRGLIRRRVAPKDRRVRLTVLTEEGRALLDRIDDRAERAHARTVEDLPPAEQAQLVALMMRVIEAKDAVAPDPDSVD
ncbi:MAG: MarR family winged helix-turn-helix transcriptional regulator [Alphaproteobacteria bacterium]|nr:MarR family winged helix-turn-helix transcriptional regulator [Alphaproteobacteria bacterium]MBU0798435.1 MarR family winged helix-turn-helix transcriptional regulator [Alphaproteobacteria bacterium]MBU0887494.1 MarR family winged helix-turn-helix transcriptional regulator [Alphaproteobacteria bacterium]MBU1813297.1 MarR family winged helix-turn-helix transcriptional regulator [Alphaproteobacteria bacterium]